MFTNLIKADRGLLHDCITFPVCYSYYKEGEEYFINIYINDRTIINISEKGDMIIDKTTTPCNNWEDYFIIINNVTEHEIPIGFWKDIDQLCFNIQCLAPYLT